MKHAARLLPLLLFCWTACAAADEAATLSAEEKQLLRDRAAALRDKGRAIRQEADASLATDKQACWDKFLVSACMDGAAKVRIEKIETARRVEQEARDIEYRLRRQELAEREARLAERNRAAR